ncbi:MAG: hypothetical protein RBU29_15550, partial [bacterium]|nr:hypothetical protein [bacterium]
MRMNALTSTLFQPSPGYYASLILGIVCLYLLFSPAHFLTTPDEELNLRTTLSLVQGQRGAVPPLPMGFASKRGIDGREYAQYGLGVPLAAAPWCRVGVWLDPSEDKAPNDLRHVDAWNGAGTEFLRGWMTVWGMVLSALTAAFCHAIFVAMGLRIRIALLGTVLLAFGTIVWPHGRTFFTEPLVAFCLSGALLCLLKAPGHESPRRWQALAAGLWAYAVLTRVDSLVTLPAAAWFFLIDLNDGKPRLRRDWPSWVIPAIPFGAVLLMILLYNQYRFDAFFSTGYEDQAEKVKFITPLLVGLHGFFFTPGRSLFLFSPPLVLAIPGIVVLWRQQRHLCIGLLLLCGGYLGAMAKWQNWAGGYDWGPRHIYQIMPLLMIFAAAFLQSVHWAGWRKKAGLAGLLLVSVFIQGLGLGADPV